MTSWAGQRYQRRAVTDAAISGSVSDHAGAADAHDLRPGLGYEYTSPTRVQWRIGEDDVIPGGVVLYGGPTGVNNGGEVRVHLSADHDSTFQYFLIQAFTDDLIVSRNSPTTTLFKIAGDTGRLSGDGIVPTGVICMWHGSLANIPSGWVLCDGTNGTPDLRDKFVRGAPASTNPGSTGGANTHTHGTAGAHTHDNHNSGVVAATGTTSGSAFQTPTTHSSDGGHTHDAQSNLPAYYTVAFIMKT